MSRLEKLRQMLQADPADAFLQYALAMELVKSGDRTEGIQALDSLIVNHPDYVAAYFQKAQILAEDEETEEAILACRAGIVVARRVGDDHAAGEMAAFLETIEG